MIKRRTLDREKVLATATQLADSQGVEELTMPHLAKVLNIRSQSLYNYVANRSELISLTGARLMQEMYERVINGILGLSGTKAYLKFADIVRNFMLEHNSLPAILYRAHSFDPTSAMSLEIKKMIELIDQVVNTDGRENIPSHVLIGAVLGYIFMDSTQLYQDEDPNKADENYHKMLLRLIEPSIHGQNASFNINS